MRWPLRWWLVGQLVAVVLVALTTWAGLALPPVLTLAAVILFGALFGAPGIALATPLVAALKVAVVRLYVEERLGGGWERNGAR
jgi:predicted PurR-regulated permease PerM